VNKLLTSCDSEHYLPNWAFKDDSFLHNEELDQIENLRLSYSKYQEHMRYHNQIQHHDLITKIDDHLNVLSINHPSNLVLWGTNFKNIETASKTIEEHVISSFGTTSATDCPGQEKSLAKHGRSSDGHPEYNDDNTNIVVTSPTERTANDWVKIRIAVIINLLRIRFENDIEFRTELVKTKGTTLLYSIDNKVWGSFNNHLNELNLLGEILMLIRDTNQSHKKLSEFYELDVDQLKIEQCTFIDYLTTKWDSYLTE